MPNEWIPTDTMNSFFPKTVIDISEFRKSQDRLSWIAKNSGIQQLQDDFSRMIKDIGTFQIEDSLSRIIKESGIHQVQDGFRKMFKDSAIFQIQDRFSQMIKESGLNEISESISQRHLAAHETLSHSLNHSINQIQSFKKMLSTLVDEIDLQKILADDTDEDIQNDFELEKARLAESLSGLQSLKSILENIIKVITSIKNPMLKYLLIWLILNPIQDEVSDLIRNNVKEIISHSTHSKEDQDHQSKNARSVMKSVQHDLSDTEPLFLDSIRIVVKSSLQVRVTDSRQSKIVTSLQLGEKVRYLRTEGDWTKIESYDGTTNTYCIGWVYTRYLAKVSSL